MNSERWKKAVQKSRAFLIQNIDIKESPLLEFMIQEEIMSSFQADSIKCSHGTNHKQVSAFIDHLMKRPAGDYNKFLQILRDNDHAHVAEHLDQVFAGLPANPQRGATGASNYAAPQQTAFYSGGKSYAHQPMDAHPQGPIPASATGLEHLTMEVHNPAPKSEIMKLKSQLRSIQLTNPPTPIYKENYLAVCQREGCYKIRNHTRGRALVITMTGNRKGWTSDVLSLETMFLHLNVISEHKFDLGSKAMVSELETFAASEDNSDVDVLFVVLMAHGGKWNRQEFLKPADGKAFLIRDELEKVFNNRKYPALIDKPKIFIIQMCRGATHNQGLEMNTRMETDVTVVKDPGRKVAEFSDYIFAFATQPGHVAHRDTMEGTWYIQTLSKVFMEEANQRPVLHLFSKVNKIMEEHAKDKEGGAQVGEILSGLKAPLYLFPGYDPPAD